MKKTLFFFSFFLIVFSSLAQKKDFEFFLGANSSNLRSDQKRFQAAPGITIGIGSSKKLLNTFSFAYRLFYQRANVRGDFPFVYNSATGVLQLTTAFDQLSLPLTFRYTFGDYIKFSGEVGGFVTWILNANPKNYIIYNQSTTNLADQTANYRQFDAGTSFGLSAQRRINNTLNFKISVFDNYGLINISNYKLASSHYLKSNSLNVAVGLTCHLH